MEKVVQIQIRSFGGLFGPPDWLGRWLDVKGASFYRKIRYGVFVRYITSMVVSGSPKRW